MLSRKSKHLRFNIYVKVNTYILILSNSSHIISFLLYIRTQIFKQIILYLYCHIAKSFYVRVHGRRYVKYTWIITHVGVKETA